MVRVHARMEKRTKSVTTLTSAAASAALVAQVARATNLPVRGQTGECIARLRLHPHERLMWRLRLQTSGV